MAERLLETGAAGYLDGSLSPEALMDGRRITGHETDGTKAVGEHSDHSRNDGIRRRACGCPLFPITTTINA